MLFFNLRVDSCDVNLIHRSTLVCTTRAELESEMLHTNFWDIWVKWKKAGYQVLLKTPSQLLEKLLHIFTQHSKSIWTLHKPFSNAFMKTVHFCSTARASPFVLIRVVRYSDSFEMWVMMKVTIVNWKVLIPDGWGFCQVAIPSKLRALSLVWASGLGDAGNSGLLFSCSSSSVGVVSLCFLIWFLNTSHYK
jgi:hypothetical protein